VTDIRAEKFGLFHSLLKSFVEAIQNPVSALFVILALIILLLKSLKK